MSQEPDEQCNPWQTLAQRIVYDNPWIGVTEYDVVNPGGGRGIYGVVNYKNIAIGIVPVDTEGYTWLVGQYRYPLKAYSWEIPEGGGKMGIDPLLSAQRELQEETGIMASHWQQVLTLHLSNSVSDEVGFVFVARGLSQGQAMPEESEALQLRRVHLQEAAAQACQGQITDCMSVAGLLRVWAMWQAGELR